MAGKTSRSRSKNKSGKSAKKKQQLDERYPKMLGAFLLLLSVYLVVAFVSYLFSWKADQDKVLQFSWNIFAQADLTVDNWLGRLGAVVSNMFFYWGFGLASFFVAMMVGKLGTTLLMRKSMSEFWKFAQTCVLGLVFFSVTLEFLLHSRPFPWGGAFGESTYLWLGGTLGQVGLALLLLFAAGAFVIWMFNPNLSGIEFSWMPRLSLPNLPSIPSFNLFQRKTELAMADASGNAIPVADSDRDSTRGEKPSSDHATEGSDDEEQDEIKSNSLKQTFL